jgi:hypothetical protein
MAFRKISDAELRKDVEAYYEASGNKSEAARARGIHRQTYNDRLRIAETRLGLKLGKVADGHVEVVDALKLPLPKKGHIAHYLCTSAQNNTPAHPGLANLVAYADWLDGLPNSSCRLLVGTFTYNKAAYGPKAVKRGTYGHRDGDDLWYDPALEQYIDDRVLELAPGLIWNGNMNILPTNKHPLTGLEAYNGRSSNIVPHAKVAFESVASMADEATKFNMSTGAITLRNYIQKHAGIVGEQGHSYAATLISLDSEGNWYTRQVHIGPDDEILDTGPDGCVGVRVQAGRVSVEAVTEGINWGDAHAAEMDKWVRDLSWGPGGMLDSLKPKYQFMNDVFSMRSRGHHELKDFHRTYAKHVLEEESVEAEVSITADFLSEAGRPWCETVVVPSNHDRHLDRWLNEADFRKDPLNARYFCELQAELLRALDDGDLDFSVLEHALKQAGIPEEVHFLSLDESFVIARTVRKGSGVECGLHGDLGPNGARGSTRSLTKLGRAVNKGHDHTAGICGLVYSAGACSLNFPYMVGPNSHSVTHIVTYRNGTRSLVTMWNYRWRL